MLYRITSGLLLLFLSFQSSSQNIEVYDDFDTFEQNLRKNPDKTYVVNFWATWCAPCLAEIPYFENLHVRLDSTAAEVVLVSLDFKTHHSTRLIPFVQNKELNSRIIHLTDGKANDWIDRIDSSWSGALPATVIYRGKKKKFVEYEFKSQEELDNFYNEFTQSK